MAWYDGSINEHEHRAAARIVSLRRHRKMTQHQLANATGMTRVAIQAIETGNRHLRFGEAVALCAALSVELADLVSKGPLVLRVDVQID